MKATLKLSLLIFISILNINCNNKQSSKSDAQLGKIIQISTAEFKEKSINQTIIDIRTPQEYKQGYIEGAVNINYFDSSFLDQVSKFDKSKPIFIYCRSGNRTSSASKKLLKLGFTEVYDLQGGIISWARDKNKIIK
ncbi:rhodanese-related sulfurtransferase [Lutibacter oceani]|uniref:Rhodanese-related sulfurtransferase n=1 Tax=Lutibacter oceani TaxID=1853311 RepID=A0A3D9RLF7_9FLAO|nr:rhodanese-like domain-containing protein [Lutibacter oceani]REE80713.1 rhodanese-related sulfurtransferase [Lutibacter oceani]